MTAFDYFPSAYEAGAEVHGYRPSYSQGMAIVTVESINNSTVKRESRRTVASRPIFAESADTARDRANSVGDWASMHLVTEMRDGLRNDGVGAQFMRTGASAERDLLDQASGVGSATSISSELWAAAQPDSFLAELWASPDEALDAVIGNVRASDFDDSGRASREYIGKFLATFGHAGTAVLARRSAEISGVGVDEIGGALDSIVEFSPSTARGEVLSLLRSTLLSDRASVRDASSVALFALGGSDAAALVAHALKSETVKQVESNMRAILNAME